MTHVKLSPLILAVKNRTKLVGRWLGPNPLPGEFFAQQMLDERSLASRIRSYQEDEGGAVKLSSV